jgi:hypothetical protein
MKWPKLFTRNKQKEKLMQHFSEEYRQSLINEHKLISVAIAQLVDTGYGKYARTHGVDAVQGAASKMRIRKVELEAMIDVLTDFIHG